MHPAKSVIFFTTVSGAGFGLLALLAGSAAAGLIDMQDSFFIMSVLATVLCSAGLVSSTFHLGNPQRAWRALTQITSSWLSREGALAILTLGLFAIWTAGLYVGWQVPLALGFVIALLALLTIYATAMIYAQLRPVPRWNSALTPACYLGFGLSSGMMLFCLIDAGNIHFVRTGLLFLVLAWLVKFAWWYRADRTGRGQLGTTMATATGLTGYASIKLFEAPHMTKNYLMKEMVFQIGRKHARRLRHIALISGLMLPLVLVMLAWRDVQMQAVILAVAAALHMLGLLVERWLFFAEAEHVVSLYYGR